MKWLYYLFLWDKKRNLMPKSTTEYIEHAIKEEKESERKELWKKKN